MSVVPFLQTCPAHCLWLYAGTQAEAPVESVQAQMPAVRQDWHSPVQQQLPQALFFRRPWRALDLSHGWASQQSGQTVCAAACLRSAVLPCSPRSSPGFAGCCQGVPESQCSSCSQRRGSSSFPELPELLAQALKLYEEAAWSRLPQ